MPQNYYNYFSMSTYKKHIYHENMSTKLQEFMMKYEHSVSRIGSKNTNFNDKQIKSPKIRVFMTSLHIQTLNLWMKTWPSTT